MNKTCNIAINYINNEIQFYNNKINIKQFYTNNLTNKISKFVQDISHFR